MHFLKTLKLESNMFLARHFMPHQVSWIQAEHEIHKRHQQVVALAEKSVRIGWTYADAFKNVRKRLMHKRRDYLFATKDYASALEYVKQCYQFAEVFNLTSSIVSHGEESLSVNRLDSAGRPSSFTDELKVGLIKFDNGSRIMAFSANPQAMAVYGGDVGLDEFAKHPNARLLWETAQGRVTWNYDLAVWSAHDGEDTLFNEFAQEARTLCGSSSSSASTASRASDSPPSTLNQEPGSPPSTGLWNLYFRVTLEDAIRFGLVETINRVRGTQLSREHFLADCRARAREEEIYQQAYMCNPLGAAANHIVPWSAIERCRDDYGIERVHLEAEQVAKLFGEFHPSREQKRQQKIHDFVRERFPALLSQSVSATSAAKAGGTAPRRPNYARFRLGFDIAASGKGDLAVFYIDRLTGDQLRLEGLLSARTEDWHFLKTALFFFLDELPNVRAAGDETGLGRQICWEAAKHSGRFKSVNFASLKHDLGFALMNQLSVGEKVIPRRETDVAADFFALRKAHTGSKWVFTEGRNAYNQASHCDIAWAGALATHAHIENRHEVGARVLLENGSYDGKNFYPVGGGCLRAEHAMLWSDDPSIWRRLC